MTLLMACTFLTAWGGKMVYAAHFFTTFSVIAVVQSVWLSFCGIMILNSLVVLWCSMTTSSFLATILTLATYLIGQSVDDMVRFIKVEGADIQISETVKIVIEWAQYIFPNLAAFDYKLQAARGAVIPFTELSTLTVYAFTYQAVVLIIAILFFNRRELS